MDAVKIGLVIKSLRNERGLTQRELAEQIGVTDKAVSKWERGIGLPDISIINKLSDILNIDSDNLLAGNVAYLENEWIGELRLDLFKTDISISTDILGKPSVYLFLCYFALAGINTIYITGKEYECNTIKQIIGDGKLHGLQLFYNDSKNIGNAKKMVISGPIFLYGQDITKCFQRSMSHKNSRVTILVPCSSRNASITNNGDKNTSSDASTSSQSYRELPITFINSRITQNNYEYLGRGIIAFELKNVDDIIEANTILRIVSKYMDSIPYCLEEIVFRRGLISEEQFFDLIKTEKRLSNVIS